MKRKLAIGLWLALCVAVLVFAYFKRDMQDTDQAVMYLMLALTIPSGFALGAVLSGIFFLLYEYASITVPGGFVFNAVTWILFVIVGYWQWFMLVPWAASSKDGEQPHNKAAQSDAENPRGWP